MFTHKIPQSFSLLTVLAILLTLINYSSCKSYNYSMAAAFSTAIATSYEGPNGGEGGSGGACGFLNDGSYPPYYGMTAAGNNNLFKSGAGCGTCYQVKCTEYPECSGSPITVTITNECPGACNNERFHFDLSYKAFKLLAKPGQGEMFFKRGRVNIQYQRVPCWYPKTTIAFRIASGTNKDYLAFSIEFLNGDGDLGGVYLIVSKNNKVLPMKRSYGATWETGFSVPDTSVGPYSVGLTTIESRKSIVAKNVIPADWYKSGPGTVYRARVNFRLRN